MVEVSRPLFPPLLPKFRVISSPMMSTLLKGENCKWCGRDLSKSFLTRITLGVEKQDSLLYPVLCLCGGITVIGAITAISHIDELTDDGIIGGDKRNS
jgi:hypothetical protein